MTTQSSRTRTGTGRETVSVTRPIQLGRTRGKLRVSGSTTVKRSGASNSTWEIPSATPCGSSGSTSVPERPKVTIGPKAYKVFRNRERLVIRFFVAESRRGSGKYFVYDMAASGRIAGKTSKDGYASKKEAVKVARDYRDKYGAYARFSF